MSKYRKQVNKCLEKMRFGDESGLKELFSCTLQNLLGVAKWYLYDKSFAEDVVAETYEKAARSISSFDCKQDGYNRLYTIAKNTAFTYNEKHGKITQSELSATDGVALPESEVAASDSRLDARAAIESLGEPDGQIMFLRFYEKATIREIADSVGMSKSAIQTRIKDNVKKLREYFERLEQNK